MFIIYDTNNENFLALFHFMAIFSQIILMAGESNGRAGMALITHKHGGIPPVVSGFLAPS
jgi:hypothetical protein